MTQAVTTKLTPDNLAQRGYRAVALMPDFTGNSLHQHGPLAIPSGALEQRRNIPVTLQNVPQQAVLDVVVISRKQILRLAFPAGVNQCLRRSLSTNERHIHAANGETSIHTTAQRITHQQPAVSGVLYGQAVQAAFWYQMCAIFQRFAASEQRM